MKADRPRTNRLTIRPTAAADLGPLETIIARPEVMRGYFGNPVSPKLAREVLHREWQACGSLGAGLHLCACLMRHGRPAVSGAGFLLDGELRFFVAPDARRQGIGRSLIEALAAEARQRQLPEVTAWAFPDNPASLRLLAACGFVPHGAMHVTPYERCVPRPAWQYRLAVAPAEARRFGSAAVESGTARR